MSSRATTHNPDPGRTGNGDFMFAIALSAILAILFLPIPAILIDIGLALSIALSILILMVALWIPKPLDFSAFPTVLLIVTTMRLALNIASVRLILSHGSEGTNAAGFVIGGFSKLVMSGDFVIGIIVFIILITVNFLVITKGATRIAEVGARFTLDSMPGKQMAIDADLAAGLIDEANAQRRRREIEEESSFFGAMDGASKFVRGDAIAGLIITAVNICGGVTIGVLRHGMPFSEAVDVFVKLSVGDGLVTQIPALIVALSAGLIVTKGGNRGSADKAILTQLSGYPRALIVASVLMFILAIVPGLPILPFGILGLILLLISRAVPKRQAAVRAFQEAVAVEQEKRQEEERRESIKESLRVSEIELVLGKQLSASMLATHSDLQHRVKKMRQRFAKQFGFVVPEIVVSDDLILPAKAFEIRIHGTTVTRGNLRPGDVMVIVGDGELPTLPHEAASDPTFGLKAVWVSDIYSERLRRDRFEPITCSSVLLTQLSETLKQNLPHLLSYKHMRSLLDRLDPEYKKLIDDICPSQISLSSLQAVLKQLLAERVSIRNLHLILEAIAEVTPFLRRTEQISEHVRLRISQQICGDLLDQGALKIVRLGSRWDTEFQKSLRRDGKGEIVDFEISPTLIEQFGTEVSSVVGKLMNEAERFAIVAHPQLRPFVRMVIERLFPTLPVLSHLEIARCSEIKSLGVIT